MTQQELITHPATAGSLQLQQILFEGVITPPIRVRRARLTLCGDLLRICHCHVPSKLVIVPSPFGMLSRDYCQRPDTRDLHGTSGNVFEDPAARIDSETPVLGGLLYGRNPVSRYDGSVFSGTGKLRRDLQGRRQPGILHLMQMECFHKVAWLNSKDSPSRNCISTNSLHPPHSRVGK